MKYLKTYESFRNQDKLNEEILGWLKKKAKEFLDRQRDVYSASQEPSEEEKQEQVEELSKMIPGEVLDTIKSEVKKIAKEQESVDESYRLILEELLDAFWRDFKTADEVEKMSDEEYDNYLREITKDKYFKFYPKDGNWSEGDHEHAEFQQHLLDRGIDVKQDIMFDWKPSAKNIEDKINSMDISDESKKALKVASMTVFFLLLSSKAFSATGHGDSHHHDKPEKGDAKYLAGGYGKLDLKSGDDKGKTGNDKGKVGDDKSKTVIDTKSLDIVSDRSPDESFAHMIAGKMKLDGYKVKVIPVDGEYKVVGIKPPKGTNQIDSETWIKVFGDKGIKLKYDEQQDKWYLIPKGASDDSSNQPEAKTKFQEIKDDWTKKADELKDKLSKGAEEFKGKLQDKIQNVKVKTQEKIKDVKNKLDGSDEEQTVKEGEHIVKKGESLFGIAKQYKIDYEKLSKKYPDGVKSGDKIDISEFVAKS